MSDVAGVVVESDGPHAIRVRGALGFATATRALAASAPLLEGEAPLTIDLSGVTQTDSAGLALLIEWLRLGAARKRAVRFRGIPAQLEALIAACNLGTVFARYSE